MCRIVFGTFAALAVAVLVLAGFSADRIPLMGRCKQEVTARFPSADNARTALVVVTDCGATTDFNTTVAIRDAGDGDYVRLGSDYVFSVKGLNNIQVECVEWQLYVYDCS